MPKFRPSILSNGKSKSYPTYVELKKNIVQAIRDSREDEILVSRSKRGQWGEWFERWQLSCGKPVIVKQGWM